LLEPFVRPLGVVLYTTAFKYCCCAAQLSRTGLMACRAEGTDLVLLETVADAGEPSKGPRLAPPCAVADHSVASLEWWNELLTVNGRSGSPARMNHNQKLNSS
jgi:hypothetical protein